MRTAVLSWRGSAHQWRIATVAVAGLIAPVVTGRPVLIALAAPLLMLLAVGRGRSEPVTANLDVAMDAQRCYEGDRVRVTLAAATDIPAHVVRPELLPPPHCEVLDGPAPGWYWPGGAVDTTWTIRPWRWGRQRVAVRLDLFSGARLRRAQVFESCELIVHPAPIDAGRPLVPSDLLTQLGEHVSRLSGEGLQFAGIRPYGAGDRARRINWYVSSRYDRLHVNTFAPERSANLVIMVDTFSDTGPEGESSLDHSLRGATALVRTHLKIADRVGVVAVGGHLRWLQPDSTARHYFRIAEALLDAAPVVNAAPGLAVNVPRAALPRGALVVVFSPLLDPAAIDVIWSLAERGHPLVVVDVLAARPSPPRGSRGSDLALRLFELDREALAYRLSDHGVAVVGWDGSHSLRPALTSVARRPPRGRSA